MKALDLVEPIVEAGIVCWWVVRPLWRVWSAWRWSRLRLAELEELERRARGGDELALRRIIKRAGGR